MPEIDPDGDIQKQQDFYKRRFDLVFLEDEWEHWHIHIWRMARIPREGFIEIRDERVFLYCKDLGLDKLETLELIEQIEQGSKSD